MQLDLRSYLRSPSTSGRSFVMAITNANKVTKVVMKTTEGLQTEIQKRSEYMIITLNIIDSQTALEGR